MDDGFKYRVFISYSHADEAWGKWLHQKLERYRVPSRLVGHQGSHGPVPRRIGRCFRDQAELTAASDLGERLHQALQDSQVLIVVCSPHSAHSHWVNEEIKFFRSLGRANAIYALIVDGSPNATDVSQECFSDALRHRDDGSLFHPLAADARPNKDGRTDGFLKLAAGVLGIGFDELRRREQRRRARLVVATVAASLIIATATTVLAAAAYRARNEAKFQRDQADDLVTFMLGDLEDKLDALNRLDIMDTTVTKVLSHLKATDSADADPQVLARRAAALVQLSSVQRIRGQLDAGIADASQAVAAARLLRQLQSDDDADLLLAKALLARRRIYEQKGESPDRDDLNQGFAIARGLLQRHPGDAEIIELAAAYDSNLSSADADGPHSDLEQSLALVQHCIETLRPQIDRPDALGRQVELELGCQIQRNMFLLNDPKFGSTVEGWRAFIPDASVAAKRFPDDQRVLYQVERGLASATTAFARNGDLDEADAVSREALEVARRLAALEPNDIDLQHELAVSSRARLEVQLQRKDWEEARKSAEGTLALFDRLLKQKDVPTEVRSDFMWLRSLRAALDFAQSQPQQALQELAAGLRLVSANDSDNVLLRWTLALRLQQALYSKNGAADRALPDPETQALLKRLNVATDQPSAVAAKLAYLRGNIAEGDRLYPTYPSVLPGTDPAEYRAAACAARVRGGGAKCAAR